MVLVEKAVINKRSMKNMIHRFQLPQIDSSLMQAIDNLSKMKNHHNKKILEQA